MGAGASADHGGEDPLIAHFGQLFQQYDTDHSGELEWSEFYHIINDLGLEMAEEEIGEWMAHADVDKGGSVKWEEFEPMARDLIKTYYEHHPCEEGQEPWKELHDTTGKAYKVDLATGATEWLEAAVRMTTHDNPYLKHMWLLFKKHDSDDSGELSWEEFWNVLTELGLEMTEEEIGQWHEFADADRSGSVKWSEFEPMAEEMIARYFKEHSWSDHHQGEDPWTTHTDPDGTTYRFNRDTGECSEEVVVEASQRPVD